MIGHRTAQLGAAICWAVATLLAARLGAGVVRQERLLTMEATRAVEKADAAESAWQAWDGSSAPDSMLAGPLPLTPRAGIALTRYVLTHRTGLTGLTWTRISSLPFLVERWYRAVPATELLDGEIVLLAWMWLPLRFGEQAGLPLTVGTGVAMNASLEAEVRRRCPQGCAPLSGGDVEQVRRHLVALLDRAEGKIDLTALSLLLRGGAGAVPTLRSRVAGGGPAPGQSLAFLAMIRLLGPDTRRTLIRETLETGTPGLRLLAVLEAARLRDPSLLASVQARERDDEPPGAGVVARVAANLLREAALEPE